MTKFRELEKQWENDPDFKRGMEEQDREFAIRDAIASAMVAARKRANLTQKQVAEAMKTTQSSVARMESGRVEVTPSRMADYARATGSRLHIDFLPLHEGH